MSENAKLRAKLLYMATSTTELNYSTILAAQRVFLPPRLFDGRAAELCEKAQGGSEHLRLCI